jgi:hypothetical protein
MVLLLSSFAATLGKDICLPDYPALNFARKPKFTMSCSDDLPSPGKLSSFPAIRTDPLGPINTQFAMLCEIAWQLNCRGQHGADWNTLYGQKAGSTACIGGRPRNAERDCDPSI